MKHAGPTAIGQLEPIIARLRKLEGLRENKPGVFYRGSSAFLHFHEDPAGFFADVKIDGEFIRLPVNSTKEIETLVKRTAGELKKK
jgi:hypothetical protein